MGRKANLKKMRRQPEQRLATPEAIADSTEFVQELEKQGYRLDCRPKCPELPHAKPKPQV